MAILPLVLLAAIAQDTAPPPVASWRQEASYRISASLADSTGILSGTQQLRYRNASPDTLRVLVFELPLNARPAGSAPSDSTRGYTHLTSARSAGTPLALEWPLSPDSTLVRLVLATPLAPGDSTSVTMDWESRPAAAARRGAHYDFPYWYPRIAAYGRGGWPAHPFDADADSYGEFASYLVRLDLPADQVVGATGLPLCGDPGWVAARRPVGAPVHWWSFTPGDSLNRLAMDAETACANTRPGRKTVVWRADAAPDFAMTFDPTYRYEEGDIFSRPVRVLYRAGQERVWGAGLVADRSEMALGWLEEVAGHYPWPKTTTAQQLASGSYGPPMMALSDNGGLESIVHMFGRNYFGGIVANDAWTERWLGDGLVHFQAAWFLEVLGRRGEFDALELQVLGWDLDGLSQPVASPPGTFRDRATWLAMTTDRAELFFLQLRTVAGGPVEMDTLLHRYASQYRFRRANEAGLRGVAEGVAGRNLAPLFRQWLHETVLYDYAVGSATRRQVSNDGGGAAGWTTDVEVVRKAAGEFPVEVWVVAESDTGVGRAGGAASGEHLTISTRSQPREIIIDPRVLSHDWNMLNNRLRFGGGPLPSTEKYLGGYFGGRSRRDVLTLGIAPTAWYNQEGGWTLGLKGRSDYLGRFNLDEAYLNMSTGWSSNPEPGQVDVNASIRLRNPTWLRHPGLTEWIGASWVEGRAGAGMGVEKSLRRSLADSGVRAVGLSLEWLTVRSPGYVDPGFYSDAGTVELTGSGRMASHTGAWELEAHATAALGYMYPNDAAAGLNSQAYFRGTLSASARRPIGGAVTLGARGYAGAVLAGDPMVRQRQIFLAGSDPYQQFADPFLRSRGSIFRLDGVNYQSPGGADVRGLAPTLSAGQAYGLNLEIERSFFQSPVGLVRRVALALFTDGVVGNGDLDASGGNALVTAADAGLGIRFGLVKAKTPFELRFDMPLWVSAPALAQDTGPGGNAFGFRWTFSFSPVF